jgi:hypothetical protein
LKLAIEPQEVSVMAKLIFASEGFYFSPLGLLITPGKFPASAGPRLPPMLIPEII